MYLVDYDYVIKNLMNMRSSDRQMQTDRFSCWIWLYLGLNEETGRHHFMKGFELGPIHQHSMILWVKLSSCTN